jgi:hypothetical protein
MIENDEFSYHIPRVRRISVVIDNLGVFHED